MQCESAWPARPARSGRSGRPGRQPGPTLTMHEARLPDCPPSADAPGRGASPVAGAPRPSPSPAGDRRRIAAWMAAEVLPHEAEVRSWLARHWRTTVDIDDVVQEVYCRLSGLDSIDHIRNGRSYFFTCARMVAIDILRSSRPGRSVSLTEHEWLYVIDDAPSPERVAEAGQELEQARALLSHLSRTCRQVIELRRLHGLSQAEVARRLGVSENVVENHIVRGIRRLLQMMSGEDARGSCRGGSDWSTRGQPGGPGKRRDGLPA